MPDPIIRRLGKQAVKVIEDIGLVIIMIATVIAIGIEVKTMFGNGTVHLADLLLMFIYLEVLAMVSVYWRSGQLPIRMPLYIGMVALARYLILDMKAMDDWKMLAVSGSILIIAVSVLVIRYGHVRFPYEKNEDRAKD